MDPIPFDLRNHGKRYKRQQALCQPENTKYVLFILDSSGSIRHTDFLDMTTTLSKLVHRFCKRVKIAVLKFSRFQYAEFCFDCYDNACDGRDMARDALVAISYRGSLTYTGEATQCACDYMLTPNCGFTDLEGEGTRCLDVVYITDGRSNGRYDVCNRVQCLHNLPQTQVNVFAIGIGDVDREELKCITRHSTNSEDNEIFMFDGLKKFKDTITDGEAFMDEYRDAFNCFNSPDVFSHDDSDCD